MAITEDDLAVQYLDKVFLDEKNNPKIVSAKDIQQIPSIHFQVWANSHTIYQFVTHEMVDWLKNELGDKLAIEIGSGNGLLARSAGITATDSYLQENPKIIEFYKSIGQPLIKYPDYVQKFEALEAVMHYKPHTVVGAFITQYGTIQERNAGIPCNPDGPKEWEILKHVKKYILFGNKNTHEGKRIFKFPHREYYYPWLFSRAFDQALNRVWIWEMPERP